VHETERSDERNALCNRAAHACIACLRALERYNAHGHFAASFRHARNLTSQTFVLHRQSGEQGAQLLWIAAHDKLPASFASPVIHGADPSPGRLVLGSILLVLFAFYFQEHRQSIFEPNKKIREIRVRYPRARR
jgi:hypothetical protein